MCKKKKKMCGRQFNMSDRRMLELHIKMPKSPNWLLVLKIIPCQKLMQILLQIHVLTFTELWKKRGYRIALIYIEVFTAN